MAVASGPQQGEEAGDTSGRRGDRAAPACGAGSLDAGERSGTTSVPRYGPPFLQGGRHVSESVDGMRRNGWTACRNTQPARGWTQSWTVTALWRSAGVGRARRVRFPGPLERTGSSSHTSPWRDRHACVRGLAAAGYRLVWSPLSFQRTLGPCR